MEPVGSLTVLLRFYKNVMNLNRHSKNFPRNRYYMFLNY